MLCSVSKLGEEKDSCSSSIFFFPLPFWFSRIIKMGIETKLGQFHFLSQLWVGTLFSLRGLHISLDAPILYLVFPSNQNQADSKAPQNTSVRINFNLFLEFNVFFNQGPHNVSVPI